MRFNDKAEPPKTSHYQPLYSLWTRFHLPEGFCNSFTWYFRGTGPLTSGKPNALKPIVEPAKLEIIKIVLWPEGQVVSNQDWAINRLLIDLMFCAVIYSGIRLNRTGNRSMAT